MHKNDKKIQILFTNWLKLSLLLVFSIIIVGVRAHHNDVIGTTKDIIKNEEEIVKDSGDGWR